MIAGLYAALTLAIAPIAFSAVQFRVSEALTVLPAFTATAIPGLSLGCALANLAGFFLGMNPLGLIDAVVGTLATLIATLLSRQAGKMKGKWMRRLLVPLPPVLVNAVIVGLELTFVFGPASVPGFAAYAVSVLIGEAVICYGLGIPLMLILERKDLYQKIFR